MSAPELTIRELHESDSLEEFTQLLHRAYGALAQLGLNYYATHQTVEETRERTRVGTVFVAEFDGRMVGTIHYRAPSELSGTPWYDREDVAYVGQLAVEPEFQGRGIATRLMKFAETKARQDGAAELALDTSEKAKHLIEWYRRIGYRFIEHVDWRVTNYRSVILSRRLYADGDE